MNIPGRGGGSGGGSLMANVDDNDMDFAELFHNESNGNSPRHPSTRRRSEVSPKPPSPVTVARASFLSRPHSRR